MIRFRTATLRDANQLAKLVNSAYRGDYAKTGWTTEADLLDGQRTDAKALEEIIQTPLNQIDLAVDINDQILGCIHIRRELPDTLYFGMLTVEPAAQGQGLGKQLLQLTESLARAENLSFIRMTVIPQRNELISYYERRGFKATGKFEAFPVDDPRYGLPKVSGLVLMEYIKNL
jgi:ribosomal protein S18 acetylase RimI-like enzyme